MQQEVGQESLEAGGIGAGQGRVLVYEAKIAEELDV